MGIVGPRPETGIRIDLTRPARGGPPWRYDGSIATATAELRLTALVDAGGEVTIESTEPPPAALTHKARLLLRSAWKHARGEAAAPPRRIQRWRA
jgi:hypothetical protein